MSDGPIMLRLNLSMVELIFFILHSNNVLLSRPRQLY